MFGQLTQLQFCHSHQGIDLVFRALEVFDAKRIDGHDFDSGLVADLKNLAGTVSAGA